ncbi:hypothetical protein Sango_0398100 [Sesamum angolense]|uniref:GST N-terminal domain-containing protein n=1 Tax=Sesamum angolense TaxID=2727404 RepID=A0AAE2C3X9_9LAMI|nr:hypothetical protein Sango_0398100 [Sesamum angolense]
MAGTSFLGTPLLLPPPSATSKPLRHHPTIKMSLNPNPIAALTKLLWGQSLPPNLLISTARSAWSSAWHLMMSQLAPSDPRGGYTRPASQFRRPAADPSLSRRNLHLYVGLPCPWAHRTLIVRSLKGLENPSPSQSPPPAPTDPGNSGIALSPTGIRISLFLAWIRPMGVKP